MARTPQENFPEEIESDRDIRQLSSQNSKLSGYFFIIAAVIGALLLLWLQLAGKDDEVVQEREVFRPPVSEPVQLPEIQAPPEPDIIYQEAPSAFDPLELERLKQLALLEEQRMQLEQAKMSAQRAALRERRKSPMVVVDGSGGGLFGEEEKQPKGPGDFTPEELGLPSNYGGQPTSLTGQSSGFIGEAGESKVKQATAVRLENQHTLITQGTIISGVLETALNTDLPGLVRAVVDEDVYSRTGRLVMIPRGSRLVGRYQSGIQRGQSRVFVIWSRVERPDGIVVDIDSPGADSLGTAGLTGDVDTHFFQRFGASIMFTTIGPVIALLSNERELSNEQRDIVSGGREGFNNAAAVALEDSINIPPTIRIPQGTEITIFVNKDLSFETVDLPAQ